MTEHEHHEEQGDLRRVLEDYQYRGLPYDSAIAREVVRDASFGRAIGGFEE